MVEVYVGLGSNVEPERHLREALDSLRRHFGALRCSDVYRSPSVGFKGDDFLNLVIAFHTELAPDALESLLSAIEDAAGRPRHGPKFAPRTLDLDLLIYGRRVDPGRRLPRGDVSRYAFVLAPLAELAPQFVHPVTGCVAAVVWQRMSETDPPLQRAGSLTSPR